jgi:hypothetical protein
MLPLLACVAKGRDRQEPDEEDGGEVTDIRHRVKAVEDVG